MGKKRFKEKKYIKHGGGVCPYCTSKDITGEGNAVWDANYVIHDVRCDDCDSTWKDIYTLTRAEEIHNNT